MGIMLYRDCCRDHFLRAKGRLLLLMMYALQVLHDLYMYMHICICIYIYIHTCVCLFIYLYFTILPWFLGF